jgi:hypothetical protein
VTEKFSCLFPECNRHLPDLPVNLLVVQFKSFWDNTKSDQTKKSNFTRASSLPRQWALVSLLSLQYWQAAPFMPSNKSSVSTAGGGGGAAYRDSDGKMWIADRHFINGGTYTTTSAIANTKNSKRLQSERYSRPNEPMQYVVPVANGVYDVRLQ